MNVLTENNIRLDWLLALTGLENNWITPVEIVNGIFNNQFKISIDDETIILLEINKDEGLEKFRKILEEKYNESEKQCLEKSDNKIAIRTWHLGFLLSVEKSRKSIDEKLVNIDNLWSRFDYPSKWESFIYYLPPKAGDKIGKEYVYQRFKKFITKESEKLLK